MTDAVTDTNIAADPAPVADPAAQATDPAATPPAGDPPAAEPSTEAKADDKPAAEPEIEYEPFKLPEGLATDEEMLGEFKALAKELKLPQADAQRLADLGAKMQTKQMEQHAATVAGWITATQTDKEFGGDALPENLAVARKAIDAFGSPELRTLLNDSGLGNHPEVVRTFLRVGKAISEDGRIVTGSKAAAPSDPAKRLFPNQA